MTLDLESAVAIVASVAPGLPTELVEQVYLPLTRWWHWRVRERTPPGSTLVVSLSGRPGTGKSTLVRACSALLKEAFSLRSCGFSLDDVYLTQAERTELGRTVHPLLASRGVPGTHDVDLALRTLERLLQAAADDETALPRFDKPADERCARETWPRFRGRPDVVLLDGWFWGAQPPLDLATDAPPNPREAAEDPHGVYREYVRNALAGPFQMLFARAELHVHLEAPNHEASLRWRVEQGRNEALSRGLHAETVDPHRIRRFLDPFERVGRWPRAPRAEVRVVLGEDHLPQRVEVSPELTKEWALAQARL